MQRFISSAAEFVTNGEMLVVGRSTQNPGNSDSSLLVLPWVFLLGLHGTLLDPTCFWSLWVTTVSNHTGGELISSNDWGIWDVLTKNHPEKTNTLLIGHVFMSRTWEVETPQMVNPFCNSNSLLLQRWEDPWEMLGWGYSQNKALSMVMKITMLLSCCWAGKAPALLLEKSHYWGFSRQTEPTGDTYISPIYYKELVIQFSARNWSIHFWRWLTRPQIRKGIWQTGDLAQPMGELQSEGSRFRKSSYFNSCLKAGRKWCPS